MTPADATAGRLRGLGSDRGAVLWIGVFALIMLDSLNNYLLVNVWRVPFPVNSLIPFLAGAVALYSGFRVLAPPPSVSLWLLVLVLGFAIGVAVSPTPDWSRLLTLASAAVAFVVGFVNGRMPHGADRWASVLLAIGLAYVLVCVIALLRLVPDLLPVIDAIHLHNGQLVVRPEVTTDQNIQVFYLFPLVLLLTLPYKTGRVVLAVAGSIGAGYVMAKLQTRSGMLLLGGAALLAWVAPIWTRELGRGKVIMLPLLLAIGFAVGFDYWRQGTQGLVTRFTDPSTFGTVYGRLYSAQYLWEHILQPGWWIPQGNAAFVKATGNLPHHNPTAVYLEGGILALSAWVALVLIPVFRLGRLFYRGRLDEAGTVVFLAGIVVVVGQLSLNVPLNDQVWLWAGAVLGTLARVARHTDAGEA